MEPAEQLLDIVHDSNARHFSQENMERLKQIMYMHTIGKGAFLYQEGDPADRLFFLRKGAIRVSKVSENGKEYTLNVFRAGDLIGQLDPYQHSKQTCAAQALEDCEVGVIQKSDLDILLWQHGQLAIEFMNWMGLMHRFTQSKLRDLIMYGKPGALCSTLIRLSNSYGEKQADGIRIAMKVTNSELADYIGCARESVNRMLSDLKKSGAIVMKDGYITITNIDYLKNVCKCELCPKEICRI